MLSSSALSIVLLLAWAGVTLAAQLAPLHKYKENVPDSYIVMLKPHAEKTAHLSWARAKFGTGINLKYDNWNREILHGYSTHLDAAHVDSLRASPDVESVWQNAIAHPSVIVTRVGQPWGLQRISQSQPLPPGSNPQFLNFTYRADATGGFGADVYVLDSGVEVGHSEFYFNRASYGPSFGFSTFSDNCGHGTHVAGTIAGTTAGVAKNARIISVKVLGLAPDGKCPGNSESLVSAVNWVGSQAAATGRPSVINLSIIVGAYQPLDNAIRNVIINYGVHVVAAAGNDARDASFYSPARVPEAITVCATDIGDNFAYFSNHGSSVDLCAPGVNIQSASWQNLQGFRLDSGTSMAAPHVAGLVAYTIGLKGNFYPTVMADYIKGLALKNVIKNLPWNTPNLLLRNEVLG